jgi:CubicO group peptidase (beta-lactamase class C family)
VKRPGGDIRQVTLGQLATHTSGLLLLQDHPLAKSYFVLGVAEKAVVDQMVTANVAGNFQQLTPAILAAQQAQQPLGFGIPAAAPTKEKS